MSTAQRLNTYLKMLAAGASVAAGMTLAPSAAQAQTFQEGDLLVGGWAYSTSTDSGRLWHYRPSTNQFTQLGSWNYGVSGIGMRSDGMVFMSMKDYNRSSTSDDRGAIIRYDLANNSFSTRTSNSSQMYTGLHVAPDDTIWVGFGWQGESWDPNSPIYQYNDNSQSLTDRSGSYQPEAIETITSGPFAGQMLVAGTRRYRNGNNDDGAILYRYNRSTQSYTTIRSWEQGGDNNRRIVDIAPDLDGTYLLALVEQNEGTNDDRGEIWRYNPTTEALTKVVDMDDNGFNPVDVPSTRNWGVHGLLADQDRNGLWFGTGDARPGGPQDDDGRLNFWNYTTNSISEIGTPESGFQITSLLMIPEIDNDGQLSAPSISGTYVGAPIVPLGGGFSPSVSGDVLTYSATNVNAALSVIDLESAIPNGSYNEVQVLAGSNGEPGTVDLTVPLNFDGATAGKTLTLAGVDDVVIGNTVSDSTDDNDALNLRLFANVGNGSATGAVSVEAAVDLNSGSFYAQGKTFDNTGGAIEAGAVDLDFTDGITIAADIDAGSLESEIRGDGLTTLNAAVTTTGTTRFETVSGTSGFTSTAAGTIDADKTRIQMTGPVEVAGVITTNNLKTAGSSFTNTAAIDVAGDVLMEHTGDVTIGATLGGAKVTIDSGNFENTAAVTATETFALTAGGNATYSAPVQAAGFTSNATGDTVVDAAIDSSAAFSSTGGGSFTSNAAIVATGAATLDHGGLMKINAPFTASALTTAGTGDFDSSGQTITVTGGSFTLGHSGTTTLGLVAGNTFTITGDQLLVGGTTNVQNLDIAGNTLTIGSGTNIQTGAVQQSGGEIVIAGGRYQGPASSYVSLLSGTFAVAGNLDVAPNANIEFIFGSSPTIGVGAELEVTGTTLLSKTLTLNGGTLSTGAIANTALLNFQRGTVDLTNSNLTVGSGGAFGSQLTLGANKTILVSNPARSITIAGGSGGGVLTLNGGTIDAAGTITNNGTVRLLSSLSQLGGDTLLNNNTITGTGRVMSATVTNAAAGRIRAEANEALFFGGSVANSGSVNFLEGSIEFDQQVTNNTSGTIAGRAGTLRFAEVAINPGTGAAGLRNRGLVQITGEGTTNVFGTIFQNEGTAKIQVTGGAAANFYGAVSNYDGGAAGAAEISVDGGSAATFFGLVKGSGDLTGRGVKFFEGGWDPGQSPGAVNVEGDVVLGDGNTLTIEIAGINAGTQYDVISIDGQLTLGGTLAIDLLDGFRPALGQSFDILSASSVVGSFDGLSFDTSMFSPTFTGTGVTLTVIPEPGTLALGLGGLALLARRRRSA